MRSHASLKWWENLHILQSRVCIICAFPLCMELFNMWRIQVKHTHTNMTFIQWFESEAPTQSCIRWSTWTTMNQLPPQPTPWMVCRQETLFHCISIPLLIMVVSSVAPFATYLLYFTLLATLMYQPSTCTYLLVYLIATHYFPKVQLSTYRT